MTEENKPKAESGVLFPITVKLTPAQWKGQHIFLRFMLVSHVPDMPDETITEATFYLGGPFDIPKHNHKPTR